MFVVDGIAYAGTPKAGQTITSARVLDNLYMLVEFASGEKRLFDASVLLQYPAFQPLKDWLVFQSAQVADGILAWNNGELDIAPERVYEWSVPYEALAVS